MSPSQAKTAEKHLDYGLVILIALLIGFGIVMQFSASYAVTPGHPYFWIVKHLIMIIIGLAAMMITVNIDYHIWQKWAIPIMAIALLMLIALPIIGEEGIGGAKRQLFHGSIQPSEIAKLAIIIYMAAWLASKEDKIQQVTYGLLPFSVILSAFLVLILFQPDISTSVLIAMTAISMLIIAGAEISQLAILMGVIGVIFSLTILKLAYAQNRVSVFQHSFLKPWESPDRQVRFGYEALHSGGLFGKGLTNSSYKLPGQLPVVHSDSIFAIIGEELGLLGALLVVALFLFLAYKGTRIALKAPDNFGRLLAFGITAWLVLQAFIHIAVVTVTFPNTGIPLPFISYGGSSMVIILASLGILLNISRDGAAKFNASSLFRRRNRRSRVSRSHRRRRAS